MKDASKEGQIFILKAILLMLMGDLLGLCDMLGILKLTKKKYTNMK